MVARPLRVIGARAAPAQRRLICGERFVERDRRAAVGGCTCAARLAAGGLLRFRLGLPEVQHLLAVGLETVVVGSPQRLLPALASTDTDATDPSTGTAERLA